MRVLGDEWRVEEEPEEQPEPMVVEVRFHDGTPVPQRGRRFD